MDPHDPPPLDPVDAVLLPTWRAAYSDRTSSLMATFAQLAYIPFVDVQPPPDQGQPKLEKPDGRDQLAAALALGGFRLLRVFNKDDNQAFLAIRDGEFAVLAFRGTANLGDWAIDLNVGLRPLPQDPRVLVHRGFLEAFESCQDEIRAAVAGLPEDLGLYITGHSLGGALAQVASAALERDTLAACYTFGSPRVGKLGFDRLVKCPHYRLVNDWDLVPGVPPPWFLGYRHSGDPRLLTPGTRGQEALRRDKVGVLGFIVDVWALLRWVVSRRLLIIDDHMIWNYRTQLAEIAAARQKLSTTV